MYVDYAGRLRKSRLTVDTYSATNRLVFKRGDTAKLAIFFLDQDSNTAFKLTAGAIVQAAMKPKGKYDASVGYTLSLIHI
jgi:hypothetical protein